MVHLGPRMKKVWRTVKKVGSVILPIAGAAASAAGLYGAYDKYSSTPHPGQIKDIPASLGGGKIYCI